MARRAAAAGHEVVHSEFFDTVQIRVPGKAASLAAKAHAAGLLIHVVDGDTVQLSFDELSTGIATGVLAGGDDPLIDPIFGLSPEALRTTASSSICLSRH